MFSFDKPTVRLYKYFFFGIEEPIMVQAYLSEQAREYLRAITPKLPVEYQKSRVIGETVTVPCYGVTERKNAGIVYVWVGKENAADGWMDKNEFEKNNRKDFSISTI